MLARYQVHSAEAIIRFWALGLCLYQFLDSLRHRLKRVYFKNFTLGETLAWARGRNEIHKINGICRQASAGITAQSIRTYLAPALPVLSINC